MDIQKISPLTPVNFNGIKNNDSFSVQLIIELLSKSIQESIPITIDDIRSLYIEYSMTVKRHRSGLIWKQDENGKFCYQYAKTKEEWLRWGSKRRAITWFKQNLGSAILKGRILAIPIIEI